MLLPHVLTAMVFAAGAAVALRASRELPARRRQFATIFGVVLALAAGEKLVRLVDRVHEGLHRLGIGDPPFLNGIDDLILLAFGAAAAVFVAAYWRVILEAPRLAAWLGIAACLAALSFAIDAFGPSDGPIVIAEECIELAMAGALLFAARALRDDPRSATLPAPVRLSAP